MRRSALIVPMFGIMLALPGCAGLDDFLARTFSAAENPHKPMGDSLNMRRVQGLVADAAPLVPENGNVWPRGVERLPTLQDIESGSTPAPQPSAKRRTSRVEPPAPTPAPAPQAALPLAPAPLAAASLAPAPRGAQAAAPAPTLPTTIASAGSKESRYQTVSTPTGTAVLVPNGNGTSTLMRSDGAMETVPATR